MDEEEYLAQLLEAGFVETPEEPDPLPSVVQDVFFSVDNVSGNVGIGTSAAINARFHIVADDPYTTVRILQRGTGDVLLIDNKDIADQNDSPSTPYLNIKNDGRVGLGTTEPLAEFHLVTDRWGDILLGGVIGTGPLVSPTDSGIFFTGLGNTVNSGVFTEVDGLLVNLAANVEQVGIVDTSRVGGIVRIDTRTSGELGDYNSLTVKGYPIGLGTTGEYNVLTANLDTSDIHIAPEKGEVYVGAYSSVTSVGIGTTAIDDQYRLYVNGNTGIAGTLSLPDYSKITLGISSRLELYHDPISGNSYLIESNAVGNLVIAGDDIEFKNAGLAETYAYFRTNGAVELYYDNEKKFETNLEGILIGSLGISTVGIISGPSEIVLDPAGIGDNTGIVRIKGDLFVDGGTTQIYSTVVTIADIQVGIATTISDTLGIVTANQLLNDAGISIGLGTAQKKLTYNFLSDSLKSTENFDLNAGKVYKIQGNEVLSLSSVGISVTTSYLQRVGTLIDLKVAGVTSTQDLYVVGVATIANLTTPNLSSSNLQAGIATIGFASITAATIGVATIGFGSITSSRIGVSTIGFASITTANIGVATVGYATITATNIGVATVGFASITVANIGIATIGIATVGVATIGIALIQNATIGFVTATNSIRTPNLIVGTTDGSPFGQVGILTVGAISPFAGAATSIGGAGQVLIATGPDSFNSTGIGLSWKEFSLAAIGGTTGIGIRKNDPAVTGEYFINLYPESQLTGNTGFSVIYTTVLSTNASLSALIGDTVISVDSTFGISIGNFFTSGNNERIEVVNISTNTVYNTVLTTTATQDAIATATDVFVASTAGVQAGDVLTSGANVRLVVQSVDTAGPNSVTLSSPLIAPISSLTPDIVIFERPTTYQTVTLITGITDAINQNDSVIFEKSASELFISSGLKYNENTEVLSDNIGNFRAIPPSAASPNTITKSDVGQCKVVTAAGSIITIQNGQFDVGDAVTIVNQATTGIAILVSAGGTLFTAGTTNSATKSLPTNGIATILCAQKIPNGVGGFNNIILISGSGI